MPITKLITRRVEKVWGRRDLLPWFQDVPQFSEKIGEIWFEMPGDGDPELLVKYLFTSERLSVQVHPDDSAAVAAGFGRGKDEAWLVLDAEPDGTVGLGTVRELSAGELRAVALDGSIERLLDWKPVRQGDFIYSPAGTVHAIGAGVTLIEVQQNVDLTYRLYDYGRPRELHLEEGVGVAAARPFVVTDRSRRIGAGRTVLAEGAKFVVERATLGGRLHLSPAARRPLWIVVIAGTVSGEGVAAGPGEVLLVDRAAEADVTGGSDLLLAYPGAQIVEALLG